MESSAVVFCSFNKKTRAEIVSFFEEIFKTARLPYAILDSQDYKTPDEKAKEAIEKHPIAIMIFTKKEASNPSESDWVKKELGRAAQAGKIIGAFVEDTIEKID